MVHLKNNQYLGLSQWYGSKSNDCKVVGQNPATAKERIGEIKYLKKS